MNTLFDKIRTRIILRVSPLVRKLTRPNKYLTIETISEIVKDTGAELNTMAMSQRYSVISEVCTLDHKYESFYFPSNHACLVSDRVTVISGFRLTQNESLPKRS